MKKRASSVIRHILFASCLGMLASCLFACGDGYSEEDVSCTDDTDCDMGETCEERACTSSPTCEGVDPSETCLDAGCPTGQRCQASTDESTCVPSSCDCTDGDWVCTRDCGQGYACVPDNGDACDTPNPSLTCNDTGCSEGLTCQAVDDGTCVSSTCFCEEGDWTCTDDCRQPFACLPDSVGANCPERDPLGSSCDPDINTAICDYGEECCCGSCSPSLVCDCSDNGEWSCSSTDACNIGSCEGRTCENDSDCQVFDLEETSIECIDNVCTETNSTCEGPDPSKTCEDTGCADGFGCQAVDDGACVPSECACEEGRWTCTEDCGQPYACLPDSVGTLCPERDPFGTTCDPALNTMSCDYGEECCCGSCSPSLVCDCSDTGEWTCYNTDACNIGSCEGRACENDGDCQVFEGEVNAIACLDNVCTSVAGRCEANDREACDTSRSCTWYLAPSCPSDDVPSLERDTCLPNYQNCGTDSDCPTDTACEQLEVLPSCAIGGGPDDPVCDACSEVQRFCVPQR